MAKAIVLLSGGLDSQLAVKLLIAQGVEVEALVALSMFHPAGHAEHHPALKAAKKLGVPVHIIDADRAMLEMVKNPVHGHGKNLNPCIDCHIFLLKCAFARMKETGADFIASGEVLGQRPMSQRRPQLNLVEKHAGVRGYLLRPLSAKLMPPTIAEETGLVDREKLCAISGRGRHEQIVLAARLGLADYPAPAGGCLLTEPNYTARLRELLEHSPDAEADDIVLLRIGRQFRLDEHTKLVMARDESEGTVLEPLARAGDVLLEAVDVAGPLALLRGDMSNANIELAARLVAKYGKGQECPAVKVLARFVGGEQRELMAAPATDEMKKNLIIKLRKQ